MELAILHDGCTLGLLWRISILPDGAGGTALVTGCVTIAITTFLAMLGVAKR